MWIRETTDQSPARCSEGSIERWRESRSEANEDDAAMAGPKRCGHQQHKAEHGKGSRIRQLAWVISIFLMHRLIDCACCSGMPDRGSRTLAVADGDPSKSENCTYGSQEVTRYTSLCRERRCQVC
jgi:hypothetical protein